VPAPGQSVLVVGALLAGRGEFNIAGILMLAWSATVLGNVIGYGIGRRGGRRLLLRIGVNRRHLEKVDGFFARYGSAVIILSRFVEGLRQFSSIAAGSMKMPWWPFFITTMIGATLWVGVWGAGAYWLGENFHPILHAFKQFESPAWATSFLLLVVLAVYLFWHRSPNR